MRSYQDYILNFMGVEAMVRKAHHIAYSDSWLLQVDALQTKFTDDFSKQEFTNYSVDGQVAGMYKNAGTFSYVRIFGGGSKSKYFT